MTVREELRNRGERRREKMRVGVGSLLTSVRGVNKKNLSKENLPYEKVVYNFMLYYTLSTLASGSSAEPCSTVTSAKRFGCSC